MEKQEILQGENGQKYVVVSGNEWDKLGEFEREILINPIRLVKIIK